jgi:hypothetical protein
LLTYHLILSLLPANLNFASLPFQVSNALPLAAPLLRECREVSMSFMSRILQTQSMFFFVRQSSLSWNQFSHFKDHVYSKSSLLKWNQRCPFENQAFWSMIQHTLFKIHSFLIVMYFKNRNWPNVGLKWLSPCLFYPF